MDHLHAGKEAPGLKPGPALRVSFHGLKPVAFSVVPLARDRFAQGLKAIGFWAVCGTTKVVP